MRPTRLPDVSRRLRRTVWPARRDRHWPAEASAARRAFGRRLQTIVADGVDCAPPIGFQLVCFSSEADLPEQVASLRSFLTHAGVPERLTIVSDGTHSSRSRRLLRALHPGIEVRDWGSLFRPDLPEALLTYSRTGWRGKKAAVLASLTVETPILYTDSDVLYFPAATELRSLEHGREPRYLRDAPEGVFLDPELLHEPSEQHHGINSGVIFLPHLLDWSPALRRLAQRQGEPEMFTGQTIAHLTLHGARAKPFAPERYVVATDDSDVPEDRHVGPDVVLRHYVTPVRHKFWTMVSSLSNRQGT